MAKIVGPGKRFEQDFKASFTGLDKISCDRVQNAGGHYRGSYTVSDFTVYRKPSLYYFELKACKGKRFSFDHIRPGQWQGLQLKAKIEGVRAGVVVHYYSDDGCLGVYYYPIGHLAGLRLQGKKSVSIEDEAGIEVDYRLKKVRYHYHIERWLSCIESSIQG
jgi:hypothetical protein